MFDLYADKTQLTVRGKEPVTSGSFNAYRARFSFSEDWNGLDKTAVFTDGRAPVYVLPDDGGECAIPAEVLTEPGRCLMAGVYGKRGEELVLPTIWANLGVVLEGAAISGPSVPSTPELWEQELARKGDRLDYTGDGELRLFSGEKQLSSVTIDIGVTDHRALTNRDAAEQHPISSISGLTKELERIPEPAEALTNLELEEILK